MSFATLSNDNALAIFAELPVATLLYCLPRMCRRWNSLLATACRARRVLILNDGVFPINYIQYTSNISFESFMRKEDGSPYLRPLATNGHPAVLAVEHGVVARSSGRLPFHSLASHLAGLFTNIRRLYVSMHTSAGTLALIASLIGSWADQLTTLHLFYTALDQLDGQLDGQFDGQLDDQLGTALQKRGSHPLILLLESINCCSTLKRLYFYIVLPDFNVHQGIAPLQFNLPVLSRLSSFYFETNGLTERYDFNLPLDQLQRHVGADVGPKKIVLRNLVNLSELVQLEPHMARRFIQLHINDSINSVTLPTLDFILTRFTFLRAMKLYYDMPLYRLARALAPLVNLEYLALTYNGAQMPLQAANSPPQDFPVLRPLSSVKVLTLCYSLPAHEQFNRLSLVEHFPKLQLIMVYNRSDHCDDCGYTRQPGVPFDAGRIGPCARLAVGAYYRDFSAHKPAIIVAAERLYWFRWEDLRSSRAIVKL